MVTIDTNVMEFQAALRDYLSATEKDLSETLNTKLFFIARGASRLTPKADRVAFERQLGVEKYAAQAYKKTNAKTGSVAGQARRDKKGRVRFQRVMKKGATLANLIINARKGRAGKPGLAGARMKQAVNAMLGKRARSVGTLKAGWLNAIRILARAIGQSREGTGGESNRIVGRSAASIAKPGWSPVASLAYNTNSFDRDHRPFIDKRLIAALNQAFRDEVASMRKYLADKMAATAEKAARKTTHADVMAQLTKIVPELANNPGNLGAGRIPMRTKGR